LRTADCAAIDWRRTQVIGYFQDGILRATAEISAELSHAPAPSSSAAELAFSVERPLQNSRIGTHLMTRALEFLRGRGVTKGHVICLPANRRMRSIATRHRSEVVVSCGDVVITIDIVSNATPQAIEKLADQMAEMLFDPPGA
jgi:GNAT superfamily N-acetyltransferase